jgi:hypothetical protein
MDGRPASRVVGRLQLAAVRVDDLEKMRAGSVAELVRLADRLGVIVPEPQPG